MKKKVVDGPVVIFFNKGLKGNMLLYLLLLHRYNRRYNYNIKVLEAIF